ncbi:MAG: CoA transferase [Lachnospiraceae bacterium]|jgi:crotonobetainyl-CoA:carnitine CoA-transferase CaiB-like acyl-CoA transferase|nr:CoA transferase [Lachnospiraceae bacterium]
MEQYQPLKGVKVIELSLMVASSTCGRMLADFGADVIKVENTGIGDTFRRWPASVGAPVQDDYNPLFDSLNANKRAISINLKTEKGQELMYGLLEDADVFLTNVRSEGLKHMNLDYDSLKDRFPKLVVAQLIGYGEKGPDKDKPGYDNTAFWARGGFLYSQAVGREGEKPYPLYMPMGFGDTACAMALEAGINAALLAAKTTGKGDRITVSLYGTAMWMANIMINGTQFGYHYPKTREISSPFGAPYLCKDGRWFMPQVVQFERDAPKFYRVIGCEDMLENPVYMKRPNFNKKEVCEPVIKRFEAVFAGKTSDEWLELFAGEDLCCERLATYEECLEDEMSQANDYVYSMKYDNGKEVKLIRSSVRSERMGLPRYERGPMQGEHTISIMKDLGYNDETIKRLLRDGVVKQHD